MYVPTISREVIISPELEAFQEATLQHAIIPIFPERMNLGLLTLYEIGPIKHLGQQAVDAIVCGIKDRLPASFGQALEVQTTSVQPFYTRKGTKRLLSLTVRDQRLEDEREAILAAIDESGHRLPYVFNRFFMQVIVGAFTKGSPYRTDQQVRGALNSLRPAKFSLRAGMFSAQDE